MLNQPVVRLAAPPIGVIAKHLFMNARNKHYALHGDAGRDLALKAINAIETGDLGLGDPAFENAVNQWFAVLGQADSAFHALLSRQLIAQVPAQAAIATAVGAIVGDNPAEAMGAPISRITFAIASG